MIIPLLEKAFKKLNTFIVGYSLKNEAEEIYFFKEVKPKLVSLLVSKI